MFIIGFIFKFILLVLAIWGAMLLPGSGAMAGFFLTFFGVVTFVGILMLPFAREEKSTPIMVILLFGIPFLMLLNGGGA